MSIEIRVPNLPESVSSATVASWHKKAGERVSREENLVDLETDKVMLEVPATMDGVLKEVRLATGATVKAGDVLAIMEAGGAAVSAPAPKAEAAPAPKAAAAVPAAGPAVRKMLAEAGVSGEGMTGSGKGGRLTREDVTMQLPKQGAAPAAKAEAPMPRPPAAGAREEQRVPMTRIRARIAERLIEAQNTAAMLT
jgi:2-oxoglutarate dehydrogenase E2 component (dihydrolipoamide succinyltransferase)